MALRNQEAEMRIQLNSLINNYSFSIADIYSESLELFMRSSLFVIIFQILENEMHWLAMFHVYQMKYFNIFTM